MEFVAARHERWAELAKRMHDSDARLQGVRADTGDPV
jgi:nicotinic acid phosphoribosyltransferase